MSQAPSPSVASECARDLVWLSQQRALCRRIDVDRDEEDDTTRTVGVDVINRVLTLARSTNVTVGFVASRALTELLILATRQCTVDVLDQMVRLSHLLACMCSRILIQIPLQTRY